MTILFGQIDWPLVGQTTALMLGLALFFGIAIAVISKLAAVKSDPQVDEIASKLGGANCGACGFGSCMELARALSEGKASVELCGPASGENKIAINNILGIHNTGTGLTRISVFCAGGTNCMDKFEYQGYGDCASQQLLAEGRKACPTGCLGSGTCVNVCPEDAIDVYGGLAHIIDGLCIKCGACVKACPKGIINRIPENAKVYVACSSHCTGREVASFCTAGCIGCGLCAKKCPVGAIEIVEHLAVIDYSKCVGCYECVAVCPKNVIKKLEKI